MKLLLIIFLICSKTLFGQTREDSIRWDKLTEQRIIAGKDTIYQQLLRAKKPENYLNPPRLSYSTKQYYTEASIQLLLEVLKDDWMNDEQKLALAKIKAWKRIDNEIASSEAITSDTVKYSGFSKSRRQHFRDHADSLIILKTLDVDTIYSFQILVQRQVKYMGERRIPDLYIYTAGMLDDKRFIPVLKKALKDSIHYNPYAVKMVLARLRIEPYLNQMLALNKIAKDIFEKDKFNTDLIFYEYDVAAPNLFYLCSQNSIKEYSKLLQLEFFDCIHDYDYDICSVSARTVISLRNIILNDSYKEYFANLKIYDIKKKHIIWAQSWLEENYGNYQLNRDFYSGLK